MTEEKDSGSSDSTGTADKPRENCLFCGGSESERWHVLGVERPALVCNNCYDLKKAPQRISNSTSGSQES
jgi:hypothetical protein